jgi:hypothetical protein
MGQEDTMRLAAEIVDKWSGPLREMTKGVHQFQDMLRGSHTEGSKAAKEAAERQKELHEQITRTGERITGLLSPAMGALGISTFGAGEAIAKMVERLKDAGDSFYKIQDAVSRTGWGQEKLDVYTQTLERFGIPADQARSSLAAMGDELAKIGRNEPNAFQRIFSTFNNIGAEVQKLRDLPGTSERMDEIFDFFKRNPAIPPDQKRQFFTDLFHLPPEMATVTIDQWVEALAKSQEFNKLHPPISLESMKELHEAFERLGYDIDGIGIDLARSFAGPGAGAINFLSEAIEHNITDVKQMAQDWKDFANWLDEVRKKLHIEGGMEGVTPLQPPPPKPPWVAKGLPPLDPGFHRESFEAGGDPENMLTRSMKSGTLQALREWYAGLQAGAGSGGGVQPAALTEGGGGGGLSDVARKAGGWGGAGYSLMPDSGDGAAGGPRAAPGGGRGRGGQQPMGPAPGGGGPTGEEGASAGQGWDRHRFAKEIASSPALRERLLGIAAAEDSPGSKSGTLANQAIMETMMNRATVRHTSLAEQLRLVSEGRGYYPTMRKFTEAQRSIMEGNLSKVLGGSNVSGNATDNSSSWLAAKEKTSGAFRWLKDINNESFFAPGHSQPRFAAEYDRLQKQPRDLLSNAQSAGVGGVQKVEGDASLNVAFENAPAGAKAYMKYGGMFKDAKVDWGPQMPRSDSGN